jgi:hypothetical protein
MKTSRLFLPMMALSGCLTAGVLAQTTVDNAAVNNARSTSFSSARDGFTRASAETLMTFKGVTEKLTREVVLPNKVRIQPDGTVFLANGDKQVLRNNQILTMQGVIEDTPLTQDGTAPMPSGGSPAAGVRPGVAAGVVDGVTISGQQAYLTRNGVTQPIRDDVRLESGVRIQSDGTVTLANGTRISLKPDQLLKLDGSVESIPTRR